MAFLSIFRCVLFLLHSLFRFHILTIYPYLSSTTLLKGQAQDDGFCASQSLKVCSESVFAVEIDLPSVESNFQG